MSIGVAVLLVGVWTVSAVQPTGDGGVEVGTWAEEEWVHENEMWFEEEAVVDEPDEEAHDELESAPGVVTVTDTEIAQAHEHDHPVTVPSLHSPPRLVRIDAVTAASANIGTGPYTGTAGPRSPVSPSAPSTRRRRPRFGTLIPELAPAGGMPTGFAFGIGAASPGFALRSNSLSLRSNSISYRPNSISQRQSPSLPPTPTQTTLGRRARAQSEAGAALPRRVRMSLPGASGPSEEHVAATLAAWDEDDQPRRPRLIGRLFRSGSSGGVKLP